MKHKSKFSYDVIKFMSLVLLLFFSVVNAQPLPADNATGVSVTPDFTTINSYSVLVTHDMYLDISTTTNFAANSVVERVYYPVTPTNLQTWADVLSFQSDGDLAGVLEDEIQLAYNTTYFWRIQDNYGNTPGMEGNPTPYSFTTGLLSPTLTTPTNTQSGVSILPLMEWNSVPGASSYKLYVDDASDFSTPIYEVDEGNNLSKQFTDVNTGFPLNNNILYYWKVAAIDQHGNEYDSPTYQFTTALPPSIEVLAPNGAESWKANSIENITWNENYLVIDGATGVDIDYTTDGSTTWTSIATGVALGTNTYAWSVPFIESSTVKVRITEVGGQTVSDESDADFEIYKPKLGIPTQTYPADEDSLISTEPVFTWNQHLDGTNIFDDDEEYELVISTDQWFANIAFSDTSITTGGANSSFDLDSVSDSLNVNSKYYWKVRSKMVSVNPYIYSPWSATFTFRTTPALVAPTQSYPISYSSLYPTIVYTNTPSLYWYTGIVSSNQKFELWYGEDGTVGTPTDGAAVGSTYGSGTLVTHTDIDDSTYYAIPSNSALSSDTKYNWWVRATDGTNVSAWSDKGVFVTSATNGGAVVPIGTYPLTAEYDIQYTIHPTLYWYVQTQVTGLEFNVQLALDSNFTVGVINKFTDTTNFYYQVEASLLSDTVYYWRVNSTDDNNSTTSNWSDWYSFRTTASSGQPTQPILTYPVDTVSVYSTPVNLYWYCVTVATNLTYELYYNTTGTEPTSGTSPIVDMIDSLSYPLSGLSANVTYFWWVRSADSLGNNESEWSDIGAFKTTESAAQVQVPVQLYPTGAITVQGTEVNLSWMYLGDTTGIDYEIRYSLYPDMTLSVNLSTTTVGDSLDYMLTNLALGTTYYWEVRATDGTLTSGWDGPEQFSTWASSAAPLVIPNVGSPIASAVVETNSPVLSWFLPTQSENLTYELQYSKIGDFSDAVEVDNIKVTSVQLNDIDGEKYFWRVRSKSSDGGVSIYSAIGSFIGQGVTDVKESSIVPEKFEVSQNYPNPFNPSTVIKYSLPETNFVTIRVYNMLGQEIATLVNEEINAGVHNVTWNGMSDSGAKVATGTYIYRVVAGSNIVTKKMILLK